MFTAATCYLVYWPNPFKLQDTDLDRGVARPRNVYAEHGRAATEDAYEYELAGRENTVDAV